MIICKEGIRSFAVQRTFLDNNNNNISIPAAELSHTNQLRDRRKGILFLSYQQELSFLFPRVNDIA